MARGKWPKFGVPNGQTPSQQQNAAKATSALVITTADGKKFGFENYCNNCYVNSVVQALYFCAPFRDLMLQAPDASLLKTESAPALLNGAANGQPAPPATTQPPSALAPVRRKPERKDSSISTREPNTPANGPTTTTTLGTPIPPTPPSLFSALRSLFYHISTHPKDSGTVVPKAFIDKLKEINQVFNNTSHQDAHEFLNYLLNRIVEEVEEERRNEVHTTSSTPPPEDLSNSVPTLNSNSGRSGHEATIVHKLFEGVLTSETRCLTCESVSSRDESFLDLSIDIEQNSSVTACLRSFSASEMLCNKNKFFCDSCCDLQEAEKRMKIKRLPNILALHLKRFKYQEETGRYIKLSYRVAFPFELRLFNTVDDVEDGDRDRLYQLFGIVVHIGAGPNSGHYVSIIKTMGTWLLFDDDTVTSISEADIPMYYGESGKGSAYVLYYQAVDIDMEKLGLRKVVEAEPVIAAEIEKEKRKEGLGLGISVNPTLPPGLDALEPVASTVNGHTSQETPSDPATPTRTSHPLPPVPPTPSHHGRYSSDTDWTHVSGSASVSAPSFATTSPSSKIGNSMQSFFGGLAGKSIKRAPSTNVRSNPIPNFHNGPASQTGSASSPNVTVTPAPPAPVITTAVSEPVSASVVPLQPLEAVKSDPVHAQSPTPSQPPTTTTTTTSSTNGDPTSTPRPASRPHPLPTIPTPHPSTEVEKGLASPPPTAADLHRTGSQRKVNGYLSPARPQTSPSVVSGRPSTSPRPLPAAPAHADDPPPPVPARPVTSEGLNAASKPLVDTKDKDDHSRSINNGIHLPESAKKDKESKKGWLRRSFRLGDKSKSSAQTTQQQVEAGLVPPSPSLATRGLTVPGVLNITADDLAHIPSPTSATSSAGSPLRGLHPLPQPRHVSASHAGDTIRGHHRTGSADRPPSTNSHSGISNGHFERPSPSPASSTFESVSVSAPFTDESSSKPTTPHSHTHSRSRSALPQPPVTIGQSSTDVSRSSSPVVSPRMPGSRPVPAPLPPVPGSATIPNSARTPTIHPLPPTPSSPDFSSPHTPFSIRTPVRKASLAVANEAGRAGGVSSSPERKKSLPSFTAFRHKDKDKAAKAKVWDVVHSTESRTSAERFPDQLSSKGSVERPLPQPPMPKQPAPEQHIAFSQQNGSHAVGEHDPAPIAQNGHANPAQFPVSEQQPLTPYTPNRLPEVYATEARDRVANLDRRRTVATTNMAHAPPLAHANSHTGSAASSSASSNLKKATRKLSFSVGFGRKDKEKEKEKKVQNPSAPSAFTWSA